MNFIKEHKLISGLFLFLIIFILFIFIFFFIITRESGNSYGSRLRGIEKVKISSDKETNIEAEINNFDKVDNVEYVLHGRLISIFIQGDSELKLSKAKDYGKKALEFFEDDELEYYDIQIIVSNKKYSAMGYRHKTSDKLYWTNSKAK